MFAISENEDCTILPCCVGVYLEDGVQTSGEQFLAGASLKGRQPNDLTVPELKWRLSCRGGSLRGLKGNLVKW